MTTKAQNLANAAEIAKRLNELRASGADFGGDNRRIDADETAMLALALEQSRAKVYEADYPLLKAREILPVATDIDPGAETFSWEEYGASGSFKVITNDGYADDLPTAEVAGRKLSRTVRDLGGSVIHTIADLRRAAFSGKPILARKMEAMRRAYETTLNSIAFAGDGLTIETGLANIPTGTGAGQIRNTAMTSAAWDSTPVAADMIADLNKAIAEFIDTSAETRVPTDLILPRLEYLRLHQTYTADNNPETAATRFLRDNGFVRQIHMVDDFKSIDGGGNGSRGLLFERNPDVVELVITQDLTLLPPQAENLAFKTLGYARTAGTVVYRPLGLRYLTALPNT